MHRVAWPIDSHSTDLLPISLVTEIRINVTKQSLLKIK